MPDLRRWLWRLWILMGKSLIQNRLKGAEQISPGQRPGCDSASELDKPRKGGTTINRCFGPCSGRIQRKGLLNSRALPAGLVRSGPFRAAEAGLQSPYRMPSAKSAAVHWRSRCVHGILEKRSFRGLSTPLPGPPLFLVRTTGESNNVDSEGTSLIARQATRDVV